MRRLSLIVLLFVITAQGITAQEIPAFPTPVPMDDFEIPEIPDFEGLTAGDFDHSTLYIYMSEAVSKIKALPDTLFNESIANESATQFFGYAKWLFSGDSAKELLGPTLAPIGMNLFGLLTVIIFLVMTWAVIRVALLIFRFIYFIIREVLRVLPFFG